MHLLKLILLLLALLGLGGHHKAPPATLASPPAAVQPTPAAQPAPAGVSIPRGPVSCTIATGYRSDGSRGYVVTCVGSGVQQSLGSFPTMADAKRAIATFRRALAAA